MFQQLTESNIFIHSAFGQQMIEGEILSFNLDCLGVILKSTKVQDSCVLVDFSLERHWFTKLLFGLENYQAKFTRDLKLVSIIKLKTKRTYQN